LDKLESIPGFDVNLSMSRFKEILSDVSVAIVSTTAEMAPADRKMYAIRDVTATVRGIPLQTASIMCKKLAENPDSLVLDVKTGSGAFNQDIDESIALAKSMVSAGEGDGKPTTAFITRMDQPVGNAVGNWLEIVECIDVMHGHGPADLKLLTLVQAGQMLVQANVSGATSLQEGIDLAVKHLSNGKAFEKFVEMVAAQGGDTSWIMNPNSRPKASKTLSVTAASESESGFVSHLDALEVGLTSVMLGAGRQVAGAPVDADAGIVLEKKIGDRVDVGDVLCTLHGNCDDDTMAAAAQRLSAAFVFCKNEDHVMKEPLISHIVDKNGVRVFD
jgi:pyrimidine-nucleoside phosphorylase